MFLEIANKIINFIKKYKSFAQEAKRSHKYILCLFFSSMSNKNLYKVMKEFRNCSSRLNNMDCLHLSQTINLIIQAHNEGML